MWIPCIIVPNERLMQVLGGHVTLKEAYRAANDVCTMRCQASPRSSTAPAMVNVDFADVRTVMSENGMAMMGSARGQRRRPCARRSRARPWHSPLLEDVNLKGARGVLVNISASEDTFA